MMDPGGPSQSCRIEDWETDRLEVEGIPAYYNRRSAGVWAYLAALTVALAVAVVYGYAVLNQESIQLGPVHTIAEPRR